MLTLFPTLVAITALCLGLALIVRAFRQAWRKLSPIRHDLRAGGPLIEVRYRLIEPLWPQPASLHALPAPRKRATTVTCKPATIDRKAA